MNCFETIYLWKSHRVPYLEGERKLTQVRKTILTITALTFGLSTAAADTLLADIRSHASSLQRESQEMSKMLKAKKPDVDLLRQKLDTTSADLEKLQTLVMDVDANSSLNGSTDWARVKDKVQLLAIFHNAKRELLTGDQPVKQRTLLRAHAEGVAKRAALLQQTVDRLAKP